MPAPYLVALRRLIASHNARLALHALPDYVLKDIGIGRSQINWVVGEHRKRGEYPF